MKTFPLRLSLCAAALLVAIAGCGGGTNKITVNGTVSHKGQLVTSGFLQFTGPDGAYSANTIRDDGTYTMTDVMPGETKVSIMSTPGSGGSDSSGKASSTPKSAPVTLPEKYRNATTTDLKYTITPETRELNIDIP